MMFRLTRFVLTILLLFPVHSELSSQTKNVPQNRHIELNNEFYRIAVGEKNGELSSFFLKQLQCDLIGEKRLSANFRICLPLPDYQCHYIDGRQQQAKSVTLDGIPSRWHSLVWKRRKGCFLSISHTRFHWSMIMSVSRPNWRTMPKNPFLPKTTDGVDTMSNTFVHKVLFWLLFCRRSPL